MTDDASHIVPTLRPDRPDDRDYAFAPVTPTDPLPPIVGYERYRHYVRDTWHQRGEECTGFALAAIANYLIRSRLDAPDEPSVSRRMLYEMAQRFDDADFDRGSTMRGALKGWRKLGVASDDLWPYDPADEDGRVHGSLTLARVLDARRRPLLRYRRVDHHDIDDMKRALAEGHALYASSNTHGGWFRIFLANVEPVIRKEPHDKPAGDHAFVIAGYDERGFWVHNSWGPEWGTEGYALLPYDEWIDNASSAWVIDAAVELPDDAGDGDVALPAPATPADPVASYRDMWPHLVVLGDDGRLAATGLYEMDYGSLKTLLFLFQEYTHDWERRRLAVIVDGGEWATAATIERFRQVRDRMLAAGIYPIFVAWETAWYAELHEEVHAGMRRRLAELADDEGLEVDIDANAEVILGQAVAGSAAPRAWEKIVERSQLACDPHHGGARQLAAVVAYKRGQKPFDLHMVSHGAGDLLLARLVGMMPWPVTTATLVASASPLATLREVYGPMLDRGHLQHLDLLAVTDEAEAGERFGSQPGSFLGLVSSVLAVDGVHPTRSVDVAEGRWRWLPDPVKVLGLERGLAGDTEIERLVVAGRVGVGSVVPSHSGALAADSPVVTRLMASMLEHRTVGWEAVPYPDPPPDPLDYLDAMLAERAPHLPTDPLERLAVVRGRAVAADLPTDPLERLAVVRGRGVAADLPTDPLERLAVVRRQRTTGQAGG